MIDGKKILLIYPPFFRLFDDGYSYGGYPLALGYLAGEVKRSTSWQVFTYNADFNPGSERNDIKVTFSFRAGRGQENYLKNLTGDAPVWMQIRKTIEKLRPSVVGISSSSQSFRSASKIASIAKSINPDTYVIIGGPHPSMVGAETLKCPDIDIAAKGEGEEILKELLHCFETDTSISKVKGIAFRDNGRVSDTGMHPYIENIDTLCFPYDSAPDVLIDFHYYFPRAFGSIFTSRGCPFACTFCGSRNIWSRRVRFRSPGNIAEEISRLQRAGVESMRIADDTFGINRRLTKEICVEIKEKCPGVKWKCEMNVAAVNNEVLSVMKAAGCFGIELGIESGDNRILYEIKKGITIEKALEACRLVKKHGFELQAYFMVGFPHDTEESLRNTAKAIARIDGYICFNIFSPFPGSPLFDFCREKGLIDNSFDPCLHNYHSFEGFSMTVSRERFRQIVSEMIRDVDKKNSLNRLRRTFSANTIWRIKELGLKSAVTKGLRLISAPFHRA